MNLIFSFLCVQLQYLFWFQCSLVWCDGYPNGKYLWARFLYSVWMYSVMIRMTDMRFACVKYLACMMIVIWCKICYNITPVEQIFLLGLLQSYPLITLRYLALVISWCETFISCGLLIFCLLFAIYSTSVMDLSHLFEKCDGLGAHILLSCCRNWTCSIFCSYKSCEVLLKNIVYI